jgi:hypothetical protein
MKTELPDSDEETRAKGIAEQCWLGPICLLFWVVVILTVVHGCAYGAECTLAWNSQSDAAKWRVYLGIELLAEVTQPTAMVTLPDQPCTLAVVAVNDAGQSPPATIRLSFLTDQESVDLRAWSELRSYYREHLHGPRFYRTKIETPP